MQIYDWAMDAALANMQVCASAAIVVLLVLLFLMNSIAIFIRNKFQKRY